MSNGEMEKVSIQQWEKAILFIGLVSCYPKESKHLFNRSHLGDFLFFFSHLSGWHSFTFLFDFATPFYFLDDNSNNRFVIVLFCLCHALSLSFSVRISVGIVVLAVIHFRLPVAAGMEGDTSTFTTIIIIIIWTETCSTSENW